MTSDTDDTPNPGVDALEAAFRARFKDLVDRMSRRALAKKSGYSKTLISAAVNGPDMPGEHALATIAEAAGGSPQEVQELLELRRRVKEARTQQPTTNGRARTSGTVPTPPSDPGRRPSTVQQQWLLLGGAGGVVVLALAVPAVATAIRDAPQTPPTSLQALRPATPSRPVDGTVHIQCSDRDRSILTKPGKGRGGTLVSNIRPGERFVVVEEVSSWKRGYIQDDPARQGWVLTSVLCPPGSSQLPTPKSISQP